MKLWWMEANGKVYILFCCNSWIWMNNRIFFQPVMCIIRVTILCKFSDYEYLFFSFLLKNCKNWNWKVFYFNCIYQIQLNHRDGKRWDLTSSLHHASIISTQMFEKDDNKFHAIITLNFYGDKNTSMQIKFHILSQTSKLKLSKFLLHQMWMLGFAYFSLWNVIIKWTKKMVFFTTKCTLNIGDCKNLMIIFFTNQTLKKKI